MDGLGLTAKKGEEVNDFMKRYANAKKAVVQIRAGEWEPKYNPLSRANLTAKRGNLELWIGNGAWFCEIRGGSANYFGLIWRHYVWWAAARRLRLEADAECRARNDQVPSL